MQEIQLIFNAGKGTLSLTRITATVGDRVGVMPKPTRKGYVFAGWYLTPDGDPASPAARLVTAHSVVDADLFGGEPTDAVLYARWEKVAKKTKAAGKPSSMTKQKRAIVALGILVAVLALTFGAVSVITDIYTYEDKDGVEYVIRKSHGKYGLYRDGVLCDVNDDGLYLTSLGTQIRLDEDTGEYTVYAVVHVEGEEQVGVGQRVLMFKQLTYDISSTKDLSRVIQRIEIHNQHGNMTLVRGDGDDSRFVVDGEPTAVLVDELFAQLAVGVGYTISMDRLQSPVCLADGSIDYAEYGLVPEERTRTDEEGNTETYEYTPTHYTVTTMTGESHTVTLGDAIVSGAGYYARYGDRDTVYILASTNLDAAVLQPIESLIVPYLVTPMTMTTYFQVSDFVLRTDMDHDAITRDLVWELVGLDLDTVTPDAEGNYPPDVQDQVKKAAALMESMTDEELTALYQPIFEKHSRVVTAFSFIDTADRANTLYSSVSFKPATEYMAGYLSNSTNINAMLNAMHSMTFEEVVALSPTDEEMEACGLDTPVYDVSFAYTDEKGNKYGNHFVISKKTEDGYYFGYADTFDMIVRFSESQAPYLEWKESDWYDREYFQVHIAHVQSLKLEGKGMDAPILFTLDNSKSDQSKGVNAANLEVYANGEKLDYKLMVTKPSGSQTEEDATYNFRRFFQAILTASVEGESDLTEEEMAALRAQPDSECILKLTAIMDDKQGNTKYAIYRFYKYSERKAYMTVELLDSPEDAGDPARGEGKFYVLSSFCEKLIADAYRILNAEEVIVDSKN